MLEKYSIGTGDRFGEQGVAQLAAVEKAKEQGITITPVWNKSYREHTIIGTKPEDVRKEADHAVKELNWPDAYHVDADHIDMHSAGDFVESSDFFTIDVADYIGEPAGQKETEACIERNRPLIGELNIPGIRESLTITGSLLERLAKQYLAAIQEAGRIYRYIGERKKKDDVVIEVSMDEVETPQTPVELFFILKCLADEEVGLHTIAPKFTGRFNKGVDYAGEIDQFMREFEQDVLVIAHVVDTYGLPPRLKLSLHSGSDKFSLYSPIHRIIKKYGAGLHLKTSGTTWLEEITGLALAGGGGAEMVKTIYKEARNRFEELTKPYATVIDIHESALPEPDEFAKWDGDLIASKLTHDPDHPGFDPQLRQFMHCSYKIAAEQGADFVNLLRQNSKSISLKVTENLFDRHITPLFLGAPPPTPMSANLTK